MSAQVLKKQGLGRSDFCRAGLWLVVLGLTLPLGACTSVPLERRVGTETVQVHFPPTRLFFYPNSNQSPERQDRDRFECYLWAVKQTGFDPSQPQLVSQIRVEVVPVPASGQDTAVGAITGAMLGAAVSRPHDAAAGAVLGAIAGSAIGAASDASRAEQASRIRERYDQRDAQRFSQIERKAQDYRRAMAACLEGRDYSVY